MMQFRTNMIAELNKKKKFEKLIELKNPNIPDEFLMQKAMNKLITGKPNKDQDLNLSCKRWQESLIEQGRQISNLVKSSNNNFYKIAAEIEQRNVI